MTNEDTTNRLMSRTNKQRFRVTQNDWCGFTDRFFGANDFISAFQHQNMSHILSCMVWIWKPTSMSVQVTVCFRLNGVSLNADVPLPARFTILLLLFVTRFWKLTIDYILRSPFWFTPVETWVTEHNQWLWSEGTKFEWVFPSLSVSYQLTDSNTYLFVQPRL